MLCHLPLSLYPIPYTLYHLQPTYPDHFPLLSTPNLMEPQQINPLLLPVHDNDHPDLLHHLPHIPAPPIPVTHSL
jgi:hypothetical protein